MKLKKFFKNFGLEKIQLGPKWASAKLSFQTSDRDAAWELYIEMLTRIVTQPLPVEAGDEKTALDSVYSLFPKESLADAFDEESKQKEFREELMVLQDELRNYNRMLAKIADVEDLTDLLE